MERRNARWTGPASIDTEVKHPKLGWIPTTLLEGDPEVAELFETVKAELGEYTGPAPAPQIDLEKARKEASARKVDLLMALHYDLKLISEEEAISAATTGQIPAAFAGLLDGLDPRERLKIRLEFANESRVARTWPILEMFARSIYGEQGPFVLDSLFGVGVKNG